MNKFENAIADIKNHAEHNLKTRLSAETGSVAVEALQAQAERDRMRCENCNWCDIENCCMDDDILTSDITSYTCTFYGDDVPDGVPAEENHFCKHFESKEATT